MSKEQKTRRSVLKTATALTLGAVVTPRRLWAQARPSTTAAAPAADNAFPKIDPRLLITPDQAFEWNAFKAEGGPTYAGSAGWKRYIDFLVAKMLEFGAVDLDYVEIPYDHYIVDDWPDRRTHI